MEAARLAASLSREWPAGSTSSARHHAPATAGGPGMGFARSPDWVAWRCGLDPRSAREHVRVARALRELPEIRRAFSAGQLSFSKVRALTRVAEPVSEGRLLELARHATAAQLERMLGAFRRVTTRRGMRAAGRRLPERVLGAGRLAVDPRPTRAGGRERCSCVALDAARDAQLAGSAPRFRGTAAGAPGHERRGPRRRRGSRARPSAREPPGRRALPARRSTPTRPFCRHDGAGGCELEDGSALSPGDGAQDGL